MTYTVTLKLNYSVNGLARCFPYFTGIMSGVSKVCAREIFDSRGNPTVEVDITTSKGK